MFKFLIYIPSYNRYDFLHKKLITLSDDIEKNNLENVNIIVSDNASNDLRYIDLEREFPQKFIKIKRQSINIGLIGNIISGFLETNWDYIWILSDDDIIYENSLSNLIKEIEKDRCDLYYMKCGVLGDENVKADEKFFTQEELLKKMSLFSMLGLISAMVYSEKIKSFIEFGYLYGYTLFPHTALTIKLAEKGFSMKILGEGILKWNFGKITYNNIYKMALTNCLFLAELISDKKNKRIFIKKYINEFGFSHIYPVLIENFYNFRKIKLLVGFVGIVKILFITICLKSYLNLKNILKKNFPFIYEFFKKRLK